MAGSRNGLLPWRSRRRYLPRMLSSTPSLRRARSTRLRGEIRGPCPLPWPLTSRTDRCPLAPSSLLLCALSSVGFFSPDFGRPRGLPATPLPYKAVSPLHVWRQTVSLQIYDKTRKICWLPPRWSTTAYASQPASRDNQSTKVKNKQKKKPPKQNSWPCSSHVPCWRQADQGGLADPITSKSKTKLNHLFNK